MKKFIRRMALCLVVLIHLCGLWTFSATAVPALKITTEILPNAVAGEAYIAKILCNDSSAVFSVATNAGKFTDFGKTGLTLSEDGTISGTPTEAGVYRFCILATGAGGADYRVYTLVVDGTSTVKPTEPTTQPEVTVTEPVTTEPTTEPTTTEPITEPAATEPATQPVTTTQPEIAPTEASPIDPPTSQPSEVKSNSFPWWAVALVGVAGVGAAILLKKK